MIYGYIRISKDTSDVENQRTDIYGNQTVMNLIYSNPQNIVFVEETISGKIDSDKRKLGELIAKLTEKDTLVVSDVSRLGRNTLDVAAVGAEILKRKCRLIFAREDWELKDDIGSEVLFFAFSLAARIERSMISARTKSALSRMKENGQKLGRPTGTTNRVLEANRKEVLKYAEMGVSQTAIGKMYGVTRQTVANFLDRVGEAKQDFQNT